MSAATAVEPMGDFGRTIQELLAIGVGGAVNGTLLWQSGTMIGASGQAALSLSSLSSFLTLGIMAYFVSAIVYSILSPFHSLMSAPLFTGGKFKKTGATSLSIATILIAGLVNGAVFALFYASGPGATFYNWVVGILAFSAYALVNWLFSMF